MKTKSAAFKIMVVLVIGLISIIAFQAFAKKPDTIAGAPVKRQWDKAKQLKNADLVAFKQLLDANELRSLPRCPIRISHVPDKPALH